MLGAPEAVIVLFVESFGTSVIMSLIFSETTNIALTFVLEVKGRVVPGIKLEFLYTPTQSPAAADEPLFIENEIHSFKKVIFNDGEYIKNIRKSSC